MRGQCTQPPFKGELERHDPRRREADELDP
jgi:hypothetical protein